MVKFNSRAQLPNETYEEYIRYLNSLVNKCEFGDQNTAIQNIDF